MLKFTERSGLFTLKVLPDKVNGSSAKVGIDASKVEITELKLNKDRKDILERKSQAKTQKYTEKEMTNLD